MSKYMKLLAAATLSMFGVANAAVIAIGSIAGTPGSTTAAVPVTVTADGSTGLIQATLTYDATKITLAQANVSGVAAGFQCAVAAANGGTVTISGGNDNGPIAANTTICSIAFPVNAGAVLPTPLDLGGEVCVTNLGQPTGQPCTVTDGSIMAGPPPVSPTLAYVPAPNPAPATVTFSGGAVGGTGNATITVTPSGAMDGGTTALANCAVSGIVGTGTFGTPAVTGSPFSAAAGSIGLTCVRAAAVTTATLTCTETESDGAPGPTNRVWGLTCPAGTTNTYTSTPALTFGATLVGQSSAAQNVVVTAAAANPTPFTIDSCAFGGAQGADFAFFPAQTFPQAVNPGATVNLPVRYTPAAAGASAGTLTCQVTGSTSPLVVNLSGTGTAAAANFTAAPPAGPLTLPSVATGQITSTGVVISNTGNASGTVTCAVTGTGFAVNPTGSQTIGAGANLTFTVTAQSATPATLTGTLTCTPSVGTPFVYTLTAVITQSIVSQIPAIGDFGRWALLGLMAGLGMLVAFRKRG